VHETRKSLKRLRATVRLARDELGDEVYRRENVAFRDAVGRLGGARDSQVLLETLDALIDRHPDAAPPARFARFKRTLVGQHGPAQRRLHQGAAVAEVLGDLGRARARVGAWRLEREGLDALAPGFKRTYRRGRRAYRTARQEPSTENLHELRKRATYLWYAAQIVRPAAPKKMKRIAGRAHELWDLIGEDHDRPRGEPGQTGSRAAVRPGGPATWPSPGGAPFLGGSGAPPVMSASVLRVGLRLTGLARSQGRKGPSVAPGHLKRGQLLAGPGLPLPEHSPEHYPR